MKRSASALAVVLFAAGFALAGCGTSKSSYPSGETTTTGTTTTTTEGRTASTDTIGTVPSTWEGPAQPSEDGTIPIDGFNEYAATHLPADKRLPRPLAIEFLQPRGTYEVDVTNRTGGATVVVLQDNLEDDSVHAIKHELGFGLVTGGKWRLFTAKASYKCQQGRGHQEFSAKLCS